MPTGGSLVSWVANIAGEQLDWRTIFIVGGATAARDLRLPLVLLRETAGT